VYYEGEENEPCEYYDAFISIYSIPKLIKDTECMDDIQVKDWAKTVPTQIDEKQYSGGDRYEFEEILQMREEDFAKWKDEDGTLNYEIGINPVNHKAEVAAEIEFDFPDSFYSIEFLTVVKRDRESEPQQAALEYGITAKENKDTAYSFVRELRSTSVSPTHEAYVVFSNVISLPLFDILKRYNAKSRPLCLFARMKLTVENVDDAYLDKSSGQPLLLDIQPSDRDGTFEVEIGENIISISV